MKTHEALLALSDVEPHDIAAIRLAFEKEGCNVTTAANGDSTTEALPLERFDLVITNLLDILRKVKRARPDTVAIAFTSNCKITFVIRALRWGADDCFIKPLNEFELRDLVTYCLEKVREKRGNRLLEFRGERPNGEILNILQSVSHDIRSSLLSMSAALKLLGRGYYGKMDEGVENRLKELLSKTVSLIGVTEESLDRVFLINEDWTKQDEMCDLRQDIIAPVIEELSSELIEHPVHVDQRPDACFNKGVLIKASRVGLKSVFRNLIRNAIKYGEKGCTITIGIEDHGWSYRLNVYNQGKPISEQHRDKLFSPFMHHANNRNESGSNDGLGLGLYLTKKIIEKHGGAMWYEAEDNGSNFIFTLPSGVASSVEPVVPIKPIQPSMALANM